MFSTTLNAHNQKVLKDLAWAIEADVEAKQFALHLIECNYVSLREQEVEKLQDICEVPLTLFVVASDASNLYSEIQKQVVQKVPQALLVMGLESTANLEKLLKATNVAREEFRKNCHFPVVIWVNSEISKKLTSFARDFQNWSAAPLKLLMSPVRLIEELEGKVELLMEEIGVWGSLKFLPTEEILGTNYRFEAQQALEDLEHQEFELTPKIKATLDFVEGRRLYAGVIRRGGSENQPQEVNRETYSELGKAIELFKGSLQLWQEEGESALVKCAIVHYHLALCYRNSQSLARAKLNLESAISHLTECLDLLQLAQRQDLVARFANALGEIYQQRQLWQDLEELTNQYLPLHQQGIAGKQVREGEQLLSAVSYRDDPLTHKLLTEVRQEGQEFTQTVSEKYLGERSYLKMSV